MGKPDNDGATVPITPTTRLDPMILDEHAEAKAVRRYRRGMAWKVLEVIMVWIALALVIVQLGLFDVFFVMYGTEHHGRLPFTDDEGKVEVQLKVAEGDASETNGVAKGGAPEPELEVNCSVLASFRLSDADNLHFFYYWLLPDLIAIAAIACIPIYYTMKLIKYFRMRRLKEETHLVAPLRFGWLIWLIYSSVLVAKIVVCHLTFMRVLQFFEKCNAFRVLDLNTFIVMLTMSTLIFFLIVISHHTSNKTLHDWLITLVEKVTFNILDAVHFLQIVFTEATLQTMIENPTLEHAIVTFSCINFLLPAVSLIRAHKHISDVNAFDSHSTDFGFSKGKHASVHKKRAVVFIEGDLYSMVFLLLVNVPLFVVRCYLWHIMRLELSVFLLKNVIEIVLVSHKLFASCFSLRKIKE